MTEAQRVAAADRGFYAENDYQLPSWYQRCVMAGNAYLPLRNLFSKSLTLDCSSRGASE